MSKDKKKFDEQLQEVREHHTQKRRFLLRKQQDEEMHRLLKDFQKAYQQWKHGDEDEDS